MKQKIENDIPCKPGSLVRLIDWLVSMFLFLSLLALFSMVFRKLFGASDIAWVIGAVVCMSLAAITHNIIDKAFPALLILLLFALPSVVFFLIFILT